MSVDISNGNPGEHFTKKRYHKLTEVYDLSGGMTLIAID